MAWRVLEAQPFSALVGARLASISEGVAVLEVPIREALLQQDRFAHGGVLSYAADDALTSAGGLVLGQAVCRRDAFSVQDDLDEVLCAVAQGTICATAVDGREHTSMTIVKDAEGAGGT